MTLNGKCLFHETANLSKRTIICWIFFLLLPLVLFFSGTALNWVTIYLKFVELNLVNKQINFGLCIIIYCTSEVPEFQVRGSLKPLKNIVHVPYKLPSAIGQLWTKLCACATKP